MHKNRLGELSTPGTWCELSIDEVFSLQINMNVEDKFAWLQESYCAIKPGGRAGLYQVCGNKHTPLHFPVLWAKEDSMSFLPPPELFRDARTSAGFWCVSSIR